MVQFFSTVITDAENLNLMPFLELLANIKSDPRHLFCLLFPPDIEKLSPDAV